jgi:archaellin
MCLEALFLAILFCLFQVVDEGEETLGEGISEVSSGIEVEPSVGTDFVSSVGMGVHASVGTDFS